MISHQFELYGQFMVSRGDGAVPKGWQTATLGGWHVAAHGLLPITLIGDADNRPIGWLIGHALTDGKIVRKSWRLKRHIESAADARAFEDQLYHFGGRWACVLIAGDIARLYLDPSGSLATVYRTDQKIAGSTPTLLHWTDVEQYRAAKSAQEPLPANHFYPAGLTSDEDSLRLMPNHYLDLKSWRAIRHWPTEPIERVAEVDAIDNAKLIADRTRRNIEALASEHQLYMGLSAGRDSRMILGAARSVIDRLTFVTFRYKDKNKWADADVARQLAREFGLNHEALVLLDPPAVQKQEYLYRTGYCANSGKTCDFYDACARLLDLNRVWLTGYGGEVGRGRAKFACAKPGDTRNNLSTGELLARVHLEATDRNFRALRQWADGVPGWIDVTTMMDLMFLELRVGCWASPQQYGTAPFKISVMPFSHHDIYTAMMALPLEYRRRQGLTEDMLRLTWPQTLSIPFQRYTARQGLMSWLIGSKKQSPRKAA